MKKMRFCSICRAYTLQHSHCGITSTSAHPLSFKPRDPYGYYRRVAKKIT